MASKAMKNNKLLTRMKSTFEQENHFVQLINGELQPCKKASRHNRKNVPHRTCVKTNRGRKPALSHKTKFIINKKHFRIKQISRYSIAMWLTFNLVTIEVT